MSENLLRVLELLLLALVYLFFLRVLRAVWTEIRVPSASAARHKAPRKARNTRRGHPALLVVCEPEEHRGERYPLGDPITLGRSASNQVVVDDTYASQVHARVFVDANGLQVEDLGSTNGTWVNRHRITGLTPLRPGDRIQIGTTVLEAQ